ncbi:putative pentatricopeptide repeat-containing protein At3g23330 [Syzygium oleosum]|uniref:putative pentatricopeptide repeat-containing protein At3g23330 n=1 Tax=Syzygium oleosum TaxID=219896 RepID=UPI0011D1E448|nr:putative pentatricopeptide repeat-containing protein At3g23330 [Syzygium oleosum]XP_056167700.1 putative pentatricopeptide repeat-containing protein At3g23330 [Syzygium oleosum]XP_056167701.1 putative pentatricopeptide repeat-containing protein At3g23330 [Syzygium oleosum]XP_056167702.1 putative pentatricopeptide repeat-containing protein At3g23330 [Syzygium oleosum]XP_056167703.1 putative pentatricopeptide repeat-containing protein At3g23330 [Syzygium oleosum]XP_056167704.1 putative pentat
MTFLSSRSAVTFRRTTPLSLLQRSLRNFTTVPESGKLDVRECVSLLQHLGDTRALNPGRSLHSVMLKAGLDREVFVQNNMVRFYALCGDLANARFLFDEMRERNLVSWTGMISSYVSNGQYELALRMYALMCQAGVKPNEFGFPVALKACRLAHDFTMGMLIHAQLLKCGFESNGFCSASVLGLYIERGDLRTSRMMFDSIPLGEQSEALWNTLLDSYVQNNYIEEAVRLFYQMMQSDVQPNHLTYAILAKLATDTLDVGLARLFHGQIFKVGLENDVIVGGALVDSYSKLGFLDDAFGIFQNLEEKDNVVCCTLLAGFHQSGDAEKGLNCYISFLAEGNKPDIHTLASVFSLCSNVNSAALGNQVHCSLVKYGFKLDSFLGSVIIEMYGGMGMVSEAYKCFLDVNSINEICFSVMISNLVHNHYSEMALDLLYEVKSKGLAPSHSTISAILRLCGNLQLLKEGRSIHCHVVKNVDDDDYRLYLENALIDMYAKCGAVDDAKLVFEEMQMHNEFSWTVLMSGCYEVGWYQETLRMFCDLVCTSTSVKPSQFTLVNVLQACTQTEALVTGKQIHGYILKVGFESHLFIRSALINMYSAFKSGIQDAFLVFSSMMKRDLVSWSTMITACTQNGHYDHALKLFSEFLISPEYLVDDSILSSCLSACAGLSALELGILFHACIIRTGFMSHVHVASSTIDMYSKCGSLENACKVFDEIECHNLVSYTTMVSGYARHGQGREAFVLFNKMKETGLQPDAITFVGVLNACSHAGLVKEGWLIFESLRNEYNSEKTVSHYACMVDLLGRAELLDEAENLINEVPSDLRSLLWKTLLNTCSKHGNVQTANKIALRLSKLEPNRPLNYLLLSNIYASASLWEDVAEFRGRLKEVNPRRQPGSSWVQVAQ